MNGNEFLDKLELINPEFIEAADINPKAKKRVLIKWVAIAASLCLFVSAGMFAVNYFDLFNKNTPDTHKVTVQHTAAAGFYINDDKSILYFPISFENRVRYGLVPEDAVGLTEENTYKITKTDIGELMGTVTDCGDKELIGCNVYHFVKYPRYDTICILETDNGYQFYTGDYFSDINGLNSNYHLAQLNLPESLEKMEVFTDDSKLLFTVENKDTIIAILNLISGKEDIGAAARERRYAEAWYNEYGNDDVYYSEEQGCIVYRHEIIKDGYTSTLEDGTEIVFEPQFADAHDEAHELWSTNRREIVITTDKGFRLSISYSPIINTFSLANNDYSLTEAEVQELNSLLQIEE